MVAPVAAAAAGSAGGGSAAGGGAGAGGASAGGAGGMMGGMQGMGGNMPGFNGGMFLSGITDMLQIIPLWGEGRLSNNAYKFQARQNERSARLFDNDIKEIIRVGDEQINAQRIQGEKTKGEQIVAMTENGFDVKESGSYQDLLAETDGNVLANIDAIRYDTALKHGEALRGAANFRAQAILDRAAGKAAKKQADMAVLSAGISGGLKILASGIVGGGS